VAGAIRPSQIQLPARLLRLRSDAQLLSVFRSGREEAFRVLHDRYAKRLHAYTRRMLRSETDAEDAVQDVFLRAYAAWRADDRDVAVRAWLYRVAHNRCIDLVRRPVPTGQELDDDHPGGHDPVALVEEREDLRLLLEDLQGLPAQQRSALIIRELEGLSYEELAAALDTTVPSVKSLLVRARTGLAGAAAARAADCADIRREIESNARAARGGRPRRIVTDHLRVCRACTEYRLALRGSRPQFGALPA
jgi:RNA polymerase sigma factor (sigma-70 family)